ncbi:hypothetical protein MKX08_009426 [Trichoderma sp. CBMAI-0020]|nr:hypothetical protein MKX08_009426 [Trichoderma sp. CBMAI-0020]
MPDADEKKKQKLAAAKKRVEQLKKKKLEAASGSKPEPKEEVEAPAPEVVQDTADTQDTADQPPPSQDADDTAVEEGKAENKAEGEPEGQQEDRQDDEAEDRSEEKASESSPSETPSLAQQSKLRSTSFRAGSLASPGPMSPGPFSPEGDTAPDIYRKHVARIEELEKENKRVTKEAADSEKRWKKAEEELADLRESDSKDGKDSQTEKLKEEIASLQRQNSQLQQQVSRNIGHGHRQSVSITASPPSLQAELNAKSATIESMEIEISKLKARVERQESGASSEKEQITALEDKVARAEAAAGKAQRELQDLKKNLERTTEKAVREGSERTSAETKVKTLEHDLDEVKRAKEELEKKTEALEKKVATLTTLHKEQDARSQALRKEKEKAESEAQELRSKVENLENENAKLRSRKSAEGGGGLDDEGVDELEDEGRLKLEKKIRSLEAEVHELRSGAWIERRREMEATSPGFDDVDLSGNNHPPAHKKGSTGGIGDFIAHGLNALAGGGDDELLADDDMEFDEEAFRKAHEEEAKRRIERIKEIKRSLKHWEGWRLDIVDVLFPPSPNHGAGSKDVPHHRSRAGHRPGPVPDSPPNRPPRVSAGQQQERAGPHRRATRKITPAGKDFDTALCDLRQPHQISAAVEQADKLFASRLDCLVNNAAYTGGVGGTSLAAMTLDEWNRSIETNLTAPMLMTQACLGMLRAARGCVVHVSSTRAVMSEPDNEAYSTTKAGLLGMAQSMAVSLARDGVRVSSVLPGWIHVGDECKDADDKGTRWEDGLGEADMRWQLTGRVGRVEDVARAVVYLVESEGVTGVEMVVDGGVTRKMVYPE